MAASKEKMCEYAKRYRESHPDDVKAAKARYIAANIEKIREYRRKWSKEWRKKHPNHAVNKYRNDPVLRAKSIERAKVYGRKLREDAFSAYGSACVCCGETERAFLTIDHFGDDRGKKSSDKYFKRSIRGTSEYLRLRRLGWPKEGVRILCFNCNCGRRNGLCPHEKKRQPI